MSLVSDLFNRNLGGGNWLARFGLQNEEFNFTKSWGGGNWQKRINPATLTEDLPEYVTSTSKWYNQLGGREFDEAWGGGAWLTDRMGIDPQEQLDTATEIVASNTGSDEIIPTTSGDAEKLARGFDLGSEQDEKDRLARMRRMLAGRYGRAETNLTGGTGFGSGSQRTLGGFS